MTEPRQPETLYGQFEKVSKQLSRAFGDPKEPSEARPTGTEVERLQKRVEIARESLEIDVVALAKQVQEDANRRSVALGQDLVRLEGARRDVSRRRKELHAAAGNYDWKMHHNDKTDFIGPLVVEHSPEFSTLSLAKSKRKLTYPSGAELFEAAKSIRADLEAQVESTLARLREKVVPLFKSADSVLNWKLLEQALDAKEAPFRKQEASILFVFARMRAGMQPGWRFSFKPPVLAQQKDAVNLQRIDRPGQPDRFFEFRIDLSADKN